MCFFDEYTYTCGHSGKGKKSNCHRNRRPGGDYFCETNTPPVNVTAEEFECDECRARKRVAYQAWAQPLHNQMRKQYDQENPQGQPYAGHWDEWFGQWRAAFEPHKQAWLKEWDALMEQEREQERLAKEYKAVTDYQMGQKLQQMQDDFWEKEEQRRKEKKQKKK